MKNTKIVNLGKVRDLLHEWDKVRAAILSGGIAGFHTGLRDTNGGETIYLGGVYRDSPHMALGVILRASAARAMTEDEPPKFQSSQM